MGSEPQTAFRPAIEFADLFAYHADETRRWREWLQQQPAEILEISMGADANEQIGTVRAMLFHIFGVEWMYAHALRDEPIPAVIRFRPDSLADIFEVSDQALARLDTFVTTATPASLQETATLSGKGKTITGTRRKFLMHTFLHSARHWAQVAMVLRQHGYKTNWQHDLALSDAMR